MSIIQIPDTEAHYQGPCGCIKKLKDTLEADGTQVSLDLSQMIDMRTFEMTICWPPIVYRAQVGKKVLKRKIYMPRCPLCGEKLDQGRTQPPATT